jgi:hypothetical protein
VADVALRRAQLPFADSVLAEVPASVRTRSAQITALIHRLRALQLAQTDGAYVPASYLEKDWWKKGPFLLSRRIAEPQDMRIRRWLAGRVERVDDHQIELRVREIDPTISEPPPASTLDLSTSKFDTLTRDEQASELEPGRFVEVGLYSDEKGEQVRQLIRVHAVREWSDEALPAQTGAGDRYLRSHGTG